MTYEMSIQKEGVYKKDLCDLFQKHCTISLTFQCHFDIIRKMVMMPSTIAGNRLCDTECNV